MLGMVTATGHAILYTVSATGKRYWGWSQLPAKRYFIQCQLRESNIGDGHSYRPSDTLYSVSYEKAILGMVTATGQAILQIVAATGKQS
jgi:hypothetical protein